MKIAGRSGTAPRLYLGWASFHTSERQRDRAQREPEDPRETAHKGQTENAATTSMEGDPAQRRLYAARIRRSGAQGSFPDERKPCLQGDDDGASAGRLRDCGLYARRRRDKGERSDRDGPHQRLSALFHDRKGRIGVKTLPITFRFKTNASFPACDRLSATRLEVFTVTIAAARRACDVALCDRLCKTSF